jgi:uncharacterized protein (TIGR02466 family)
MEKVKILPQTIYKFKCDKNLLRTTNTLMESEEWVENKYNFRTSNERLEKNPNYIELINWFDKCLSEVKTELDFKCDQLKITQCWGNKSYHGNWHHPHTHPNSIVSGVFYVNSSNSNTWFSIKSIWDSFNGLSHETFRLIYDDNSTTVIHKNPTIAGDLIIFPSTLYHSVDEHLAGDEYRYTISFNSFPIGKVGSFPALNGLEIEIK